MTVDPLWKEIAEALDFYVKPVIGDQMAQAVAVRLRSRFIIHPIPDATAVGSSLTSWPPPAPIPTKETP